MNILSAAFIKHHRPFHSKRNKFTNHYLIRLQAEGSCRAIINQAEFHLRAGDLILVKPNDSYELIITVDEEKPVPSGDYYLFIDYEDAEWLEDWWQGYIDTPYQHIGLDEICLSYWKHLTYEKKRVKDAEPLLLDYLTRCLLLHIKRILESKEFNLTYPSERSVASQIKVFIENHATKPITLQDAAASAGLGISRASQLFRETFQQSIMDYAIEVRLSRAQERMLFSGESLQEIAELSGFANYTHFSRLFRSRFGISPNEYKKSFS